MQQIYDIHNVFRVCLNIEIHKMYQIHCLKIEIHEIHSNATLAKYRNSTKSTNCTKSACLKIEIHNFDV